LIQDEYKNKYGYNIIIPNLLREINKNEYRQGWKNRLMHQINNLPEFDSIIKDLDKLIRERLLF